MPEAGFHGFPGATIRRRSYAGAVRGIPKLIGYWRLQETTGTAAADELGTHAGTYTGGYTLAQSGPFPGSRSVQFNGSTSYVQIASAVGDSSQRSVAAWVKSSTNQTSKAIFDETQGSGVIHAMTLRTGPNPVAGGLASHLSGGITGSNFSVLAGSTGCPLNDGQWHHVVVVVNETVGVQWSATRTTLYYDGQKVPASIRSDENYAGTSRNAPTVAIAPRIGNAAAASSYWTGYIAEVAIWANALTAADVQRLFAARSR